MSTEALPVDLGGLGRWMDEQALGAGPIVDVELLGGGTQNWLVRFRRAAEPAVYVLRWPPTHKRANSDETMRREARVLRALEGTDVPHPRLIADCPDEARLGSAFYLMEVVDGVNVTTTVPAGLHDPAAQRALGGSVADAVASIGRVDLDAAGLADLGRPDGWLERQVDRWRRQLDGYVTFAGYPGPALPALEPITDWLVANRPAAAHLGLVHGDFHLANVLVDPDRSVVTAVVDWELATVGDPLLDLGHLAATWPAAGNDPPTGGPAFSGFPPVAELVDRYAARSGRDVTDFPWFHVLACYRLGILLEGSVARAAAGLAPREIGDHLGAVAIGLFERAARLL